MKNLNGAESQRSPKFRKLRYRAIRYSDLRGSVQGVRPLEISWNERISGVVFSLPIGSMHFLFIYSLELEGEFIGESW